LSWGFKPLLISSVLAACGIQNGVDEAFSACVRYALGLLVFFLLRRATPAPLGVELHLQGIAGPWM
jgi:hypothetical protein